MQDLCRLLQDGPSLSDGCHTNGCKQACAGDVQSIYTVFGCHGLRQTWPQRCIADIVAICAALVFHKVGVFEVGLMVFMGRLDKLASHILPCDDDMAQLSISDRTSMLQSRLQPIM